MLVEGCVFLLGEESWWGHSLRLAVKYDSVAPVWVWGQWILPVCPKAYPFVFTLSQFKQMKRKKKHKKIQISDFPSLPSTALSFLLAFLLTPSSSFILCLSSQQGGEARLTNSTKSEWTAEGQKRPPPPKAHFRLCQFEGVAGRTIPGEGGSRQGCSKQGKGHEPF